MASDDVPIGTVIITVRAPAPLYARARDAAAAKGVSLNAFAVEALEAALGSDWKLLTARKGRSK